MTLLHPPRRIALMLAVLLAAGCDGFDSGTPPNAPDPSESTLSFETDNVSITEEGSPVTIGVTISNPPGTEVSAEVLYANEASGTDASDFNLPDSAAIGDGNAYVVGTVVFPDTATDGHTQTLELDIQDEEENEEQEDGIFVLQNVQGNVSIGETNQMTVSIGAIEIFFEDFSDEELAPMTVANVTNGNGWGIGSSGDEPSSPFASANAFGGSEPSNSWLITPALNFNEYEDEVLTFRNAKNFDDGGLDQPLQVKVSTDYDGSGSPEDFTWTDITDRVENFSEGGYTYVSSGEIDLSDEQFQGEEAYVAFQYRSSGTGAGSSEERQVDDIRIVGR